MTNKPYGFDPEELGLKRGRYAGKHEMHVECPFHGGSGKSASFNFVTGKFYCFKCRAEAGVHKLAKHTGGRIVRKKIKVKYEDDVDNWNDLLKNKVDPNNQYLLQRGVTSEQIERHQIRETNKGIAVPINDSHGRDVGVVVRQTSNKIRYLYGGKRLPLWPLQSLKTYHSNDPLYVVEGIFGVLRGEKFGHNVIATLGAMVKKEVVDYLRHFSNLVIVFDDDDAGYLGASKLLKRIPHARVRVPGVAVDEIGKGEWDNLCGDGFLTRDVGLIKSKIVDQKMRERF